MAEKYVGAIVLELDGQEIECASCDVKTVTGRVLVKTMNRTGRAKGHANGITTFELTIEAAIPLDATEPDWGAIDNARVTFYPVGHDGQRESYTGCATMEVGGAYKVEGAAVRRLTMVALDKVVE